MDKWTWGTPANTAISAGRSAADRPRGRLAAHGLTYTNFHVNALCSPTRMSLLTGRNQHQCSAATVVDTSTGYPGDTGVRPDSCATIGEIAHRWGYVTSYFGKCHEVPPHEVSVSGPFDRWPARSGFANF